jgi:ribonucleotide reductase beta subunit family protein with ferritin-like domain
MQELISSPNNNPYTLFPIQYPDLYSIYEDQRDSFWKVQELDLSSDKADYDALTDNEKLFINNVLAFFAGSDGLVIEMIFQKLAKYVTLSESRNAYAIIAGIEAVHSEMYSQLIETYIDDPMEKDKLFHAMERVPGVRAKMDFALEVLHGDEDDIAKLLLAAILVESVQFQSSFASIFFLKANKPGKLKGLTNSNDFIQKDEALHWTHNVMLYNKLEERLSVELVHATFKKAVDIEEVFVRESIPVALIGMNADLMIQYVKSVADAVLYEMGYPALYHEKNPFGFMESLGIESKTNFFEDRNNVYKSMSDRDLGANAFDVDDEF